MRIMILACLALVAVAAQARDLTVVTLAARPVTVNVYTPGRPGSFTYTQGVGCRVGSQSISSSDVNGTNFAEYRCSSLFTQTGVPAFDVGSGVPVDTLTVNSTTYSDFYLCYLTEVFSDEDSSYETFVCN
jgi:hypothetical protein